MSPYQKELEVAISIAREAGVIMLQYFDGDQQVETKEDKTLVTIADKLVNSLVIKKLNEAFPADGIIGEEESTSEYGMGRKWFCDPIDGTAGYIWGTPTGMFSLALIEDGKAVLGVAYDPFLDKMYTGVKDQASMCNGKAIRVSELTLNEGTVAVTGSIRTVVAAPYVKKLVDDKIKIACFSGMVYKACLIAKGKLTGHIELGANAHDVAAVEVIVAGAGGKTTDREGKPLDYSKPIRGCIISNNLVHEDLLKYL